MYAPFLIGLLALFPANTAALTVSVPPETTPLELTSTTTIEAHVREVQDEYGLGRDFYDTLKCESMGWRNVQSHHPSARGPNGRENSWGVAQIHLPSHPEVTQEQALDVRFAVEWTAKAFVAGDKAMWTCWHGV